jgi:Fur family ferric uptake transcriptional regulator
MKQAEHILSESGIRPTAIRLMVLKEIIEHERAFTLADMEQRFATLDRSTLFRTLTLFVKHNLLHEADNGSGSKLYCPCECQHEQHHTPHLHFICTSCHETYCIKDIDLSVLPQPEGYKVEEVNLIMKGLCPKCRQEML